MTGLVVLVAAFFLAMGVVALVHPERVVRLFGTPALSTDGRNEVRAVYGGFGVAIGSLVLASLGLPTLRPGILVSVATAVFGMALGRVISRVVDGRAGPYPRLFLAVELLLGGALVAALVA